MIRTQAELDAFLPQLQGVSRIALDTEADSLHAYPEKLCLVQISQGDLHVLIDPLAGMDFSGLLALLGRAELILHGADYDLRLLHRTYGFVPTSIFDTMWAARLCGLREFGLQHLVQQHLGVSLEKGPQKMNWAVRPLPPRMAAYALNDTRYLAPLADALGQRLAELGRMPWLREISETVIRDCSRPRQVDPGDLWRIKGSDRLERPAMAVLRELWHWRETEALGSNKPPYFILSHERLVAIAAAAGQGRPVQNLVPAHISAKRAARLAAAIDRGLKIPASQFPLPRRAVGVRLTHAQQEEFDRLKAVRDRQAEQLNLDPTVIASKGDLTLLAKGSGNSEDGMMRWQRMLLGIK